MLLFALIMACVFFAWRNRIPFAAVMLSTVSQVTTAFPAMSVAALVSLFVMLLWSGLFSYTTIVTLSWTEGGTAYACYVFLLFSFYW